MPVDELLRPSVDGSFGADPDSIVRQSDHAIVADVIWPGAPNAIAIRVTNQVIHRYVQRERCGFALQRNDRREDRQLVHRTVERRREIRGVVENGPHGPDLAKSELGVLVRFWVGPPTGSDSRQKGLEPRLERVRQRDVSTWIRMKRAVNPVRGVDAVDETSLGRLEVEEV